MTGTQAHIVLRHVRQLAAAYQTGPMSDGELLERFATRREEEAFAALVKRHGPMVLGVCRRVLHDAHDADDAFQATFLTLARKAGCVGRADSVAGWLYRVAYHVAVKALARKASRREHERRAEVASPADPLSELTGRELLRVLDEELHRLPERLRAPLVLCYLEGKARDEAAHELGWSLGTLKRRLEQARVRLHARLAGRGVSLAALLPAGAAGPALSPALTAATTGAAVLVAAGNQAAVPAGVADLLAQTLRATTAGPRKAVAALLLTATLIAGATALAFRAPSAAGEAPKPAPQARPAAPPTADDKDLTVSGRVLDADGKPVAEAEVVVVARGWDFAAQGYRVLRKGNVDKDGRYRLTVPRLSSGESIVLAGKPGFGLGQQLVNPQAAKQETTFVLPTEQSLRGRLLDLQGQPAAGVKVAVMQMGTRDDVSLFTPPEDVPLWPKAATSDADGRFTISRLPRRQEVWLLVQGDRFGWQHLRLSADHGDKEISWSLSPARLLQGKVVYEDTGKPAANVRLTVSPPGISARSDAAGRFTVSLPAVAQSSLPPLSAYPVPGDPYLPVHKEFTWPRGAVKHEVEVKLPRGVLVRGKATEAPSGRALAGAGVQFVPRETDNPNLRPDVLTAWQYVAASGDDGTFQLAVLPGPGHLLVSGPGRDFIHEVVGDNVLRAGKPGGYRHYPDGLVKLDLAPKADPKEVTITLRRGVTVRGRLVGPADKPVAHAVMACRLLHRAVPTLPYVEVRDGEFALHGCDPDKEYPVYFLDGEHGWGASVTLGGKQAGGDPVTVRLAPCGRATGRLVDADGKPLKDYPLKPLILQLVVTPGPPGEDFASKELLADEEFAENLVSRKERVARRGLRSDAEGRFGYDGLIPGATYRLKVLGKDGVVLKKEFQARAEKTLDLEDIPINKAQ